MSSSDRSRSQHFVTMYVLIALLAMALAFTAFRMASTDNTRDNGANDGGKWECSRATCGTFVDPVAWVASNCPAAVGDAERSCTVNIGGSPTTVPLSVINLTYVAEQCEVVSCVQEVLTRPVNYTVPATP